MTPGVVRSAPGTRGVGAVRTPMMTPRRYAARDDAATIRRMDPYGVLGLPSTATPEEVAATYRRLAKEWHPDRGGAPERMAAINVAYDVLRATAWTRRHEPHAAPARPPVSGRGAWLPHAIRRALGHELLGVVESGEKIWLVTPTTTWASPQALLAASDRRLLWLLDDAVNGRVQTLRFANIEAIEHTLRRPRKRVATLRVRARNGRRFAFGELRPATAAALARRIADARGA
jgi:DnaJ domain